VLVDVRINAGRSVQLVLDTGAALTMIAPRALSALGVDMSRTRAVEVRGVTGSTTARIVYLESLAVGEVRVGPLWVLAHDAHMPRGDGLLGRDFLDRFAVTVDPRQRVVTLSER
jgi:predicted aspartyl protease